MSHPVLRMKKVCCAIALVLVAGCGGLRETIRNAGPQEAVITLDTNIRYQTMVAWEATDQAGKDFSSFAGYQNMLISNVANDLRINRLRVELRSGAENGLGPSSSNYEIVNDNDDPLVINENGFHFGELDSTIDAVVLPMKKLLEERGESLLINLNYVDFGPSTFEHKEHPEEYAEFILAAFLHMKKKYGFVPDTVELVLEPDTDAAEWSAKQVAAAAIATSARLKESGFEPAFVTPSTTNASNAVKYIDEFAAIPGAMDSIVEFSYHRYAGVSEKVLTEIADRGKRYGKRTSMLEWIGADQETLHADLKLANVSAWQQYTIAYSGRDEGDKYYTVESEDSDSSITMGRRTRYLRQYFRCVKPGYVRVSASTTNPSLDPVAFQSSTGSISVIIKADSAGTATIRGLPPQTYTVSYATEDEPDFRMAGSSAQGNGELSVRIPAAGVLSICAE